MTNDTIEREQSRWSDRQWAGTALRFAIAIGPTVVAAALVYVLLHVTQEPVGFTPAVIRLILISLIGYVVARATTALAHRLLPLAALLKLSLVFPDQAPSRFRLAVKASSTKMLQREADRARVEGLSSDQTVAAEQIILLTAAVGAHDRRTRGHSERVRLYAQLLGEQLGLSDDDLARLQWGALLHDLGKVRVPTEILNKPGKLDEEEWAVMSSHPAAGRELIGPLAPFLGEWAAATDAHHEKWDGSGYPLGLAGTRIPQAGRIVAVADSYEVMTAARAYKKPMSPEAARAELTASAGTHFDPTLVRAFLDISVGRLRTAAGPLAFALSVPLYAELGGLGARLVTLFGSFSGGLAAPATASVSAMLVASANVGIVIPEEAPLETLAFVHEGADAFGEDVSAELPAEATEASIEVESIASAGGSADEPEASSAPLAAEPGATTETTLASGASSPTTAGGPSSTVPTPPSAPGNGPPSTNPSESTTTQAPANGGDAPGSTSTSTAPPTAPNPVVVGDGELILMAASPASLDFTSDGPYQDSEAFFLHYEGAIDGDFDFAALGIKRQDLNVNPNVGLCSFYLFMSPGQDGANEELTLAFPTRPVSVISSEEHLDASDSFGIDGTTYEMNRGFENNDSIEIVRSGNARQQVEVSVGVRPNMIDSARIILPCS